MILLLIVYCWNNHNRALTSVYQGCRKFFSLSVKYDSSVTWWGLKVNIKLSYTFYSVEVKHSVLLS